MFGLACPVDTGSQAIEEARQTCADGADMMLRRHDGHEVRAQSHARLVQAGNRANAGVLHTVKAPSLQHQATDSPRNQRGQQLTESKATPGQCIAHYQN